MEVKVKRKTGLLGGISKIALRVNGQEVRKLEEGDEHTIRTDKKQITIQVSSGFRNSKKAVSTTNETVWIQVNPICLWLFALSLVTIFSASFFDERGIKLICALVGFVCIFFTLVYSSIAWFVLRKQ